MSAGVATSVGEVLVFMDGDGADSEFGCRPHDANGYFATIRNEDAADRAALEKGIHVRMMIALMMTHRPEA